MARRYSSQPRSVGGGGGGEDGQHERAGSRAGCDLGQKPAEESQPRDARRHRHQSQPHRAGDAMPHAFGERPEPTVEVHGQPGR